MKTHRRRFLSFFSIRHRESSTRHCEGETTEAIRRLTETRRLSTVQDSALNHSDRELRLQPSRLFAGAQMQDGRRAATDVRVAAWQITSGLLHKSGRPHTDAR